MKHLTLLILLLLYSCEDNITENSESEEFSLFFIASEGNFGSSNGSIDVFFLIGDWPLGSQINIPSLSYQDFFSNR